MSTPSDALKSEFTLNMIAPGLTAFAPPGGDFDPSGAWEMTYGVFTLAGACELAGGLKLRREPGADGSAAVRLDYEKNLPAGHVQKVTGVVNCARDELSTPSRWKYAVDVRDGVGASLPNMKLEKSAVVADGVVEIMSRGHKRLTPIEGPFTINWLLFDAVQRLPRRKIEPHAFTMLDHFDQVKLNQRLSYHKSVKTEFAGSRRVRLHAFDHVGDGIVPWVYWVDDKGRLLFAVSGIEAYIWRAS